MITDKLKELEALRARTIALETAVAKALQDELKDLHLVYGFETVQEFVDAVAVASGRPRSRSPGASASGTKRRTRAVITDEMRAEVKKLVKEGKTGAEIAKAVGISLPSVQNVKKALGLVHERK